MIKLSFEKISRYDRKNEFAETAVPFPRGQLTDVSRVMIIDGSSGIRPQTNITAKWPDNSVKWLHVSFLADLPGNAGKDFFLSADGCPAEKKLPAAAADMKNRKVDTGVLEAVLAEKGASRLFDSVNGPSVFSGSEIEGPVLTSGGTDYTIKLEQDWELCENGPYRVIAKNSGRHFDSRGKALFGFTVKLIFTAGHPWFGIEYCFSHCEEDPVLPLEALVIRIREQSPDAKVSLGISNYNTRITENMAKDGVEKVIDAEHLLYDSNEQVPETLYGTFWADWRVPGKGICATIFQAHQNYPKALRCDSGGMTVSLMPAGQKALQIYQGMEKTHHVYFHLHNGNESLNDLNIRSLQIQMPDRPVPDVSVFRKAGVLENIFMENPVLSVEAKLCRQADTTGYAYGMLNWGDMISMGYTNQGRGREKPVWTNAEYDPPHSWMLMYARTGKRRFLDRMLVGVRHWMDVDITHYSKDPLQHRGQQIHAADHVGDHAVTPSHEWVEGLLDYYHVTADKRALDCALDIGENILRHLERPVFHQKGEISARETGWALRTLTALFIETNNEKWLEKCEWIVGHFVEWKEEFGFWLAPYTAHTVVRVPFMISIAVNSLMRYYRVRPSERIKEMILSAVTDMLDTCRNPDGLFYYKELPSLQMTANLSMILESLAYAWEISGDKKYLEGGLALYHSELETEGQSDPKHIAGDAVITGGWGTKYFAVDHIPVAVFTKALDTADMRGKIGGEA